MTSTPSRMHWVRKSDTDEMYCAVHNYQCDLHDHPGDPMVLNVAPHLHPSAWICPDAVEEIADQRDEARKYAEENEVDGAGFYLPAEDEEVIHEALLFEGRDELARQLSNAGLESFSHRDLDRATVAVEDHQDDLPDRAEQTMERLLEFAEE